MMASNHYYFAMFGVLFIFSIFFLVSGETNDMYESLFRSPLKRVFVYGTLKRGQPNHELLSSSSNGYAKFIGIGKTLHKYPLVIASKYNIPFLLKHPGVGHQILGELYDVDSKMMDKLDELEEHPSFYVRTEEDIIMARDKKDVNIEQIGCVTKAWTYFLPKFKSNLLQLPMYSSYASEGVHGLKYGESQGHSAKPEEVM
ncbi:putative gamma-glutamylcyclotransferase CG2811 isoform X2 [Diachasmimorpha longicaudata]|uniref:putative gamma-glutamylcyclotransferase CG2811 isoform X2 n=1 Tax=Diachasmimorpha longicaudata TaxID=58733 RepID=UPI0030B8C4BF